MITTAQQMSTLAQAGVNVTISASDLLRVMRDVWREETNKAQQDTFIPVIPYGVDEFGACAATIRKRIKDGTYRGHKTGGVWYVYTKQDHDRRMNYINN